jgi:hypothetical protein
MKTFNRYCRGEQANPLPDEEFIRDRDHPVVIDGERDLQQNERRMDEPSQHFSLPSYGMPTQVSFTQEAVAEHNSTQIDHLGEYQAFRRLYPFDSTAAMETLAVFRAEAELHPDDAVLARIVEDMEQCIGRQERIDVTSEVNNADLLYMYGIIRNLFDAHMGRYCSSERYEEVLNVDEDGPLPDYEDDEEAADYYREHEEPEVSFYEWTIRNYEANDTYNIGFPTEDALDQDLNHYEWYLSNYSTQLQLNDFRLRRAEIANGYYGFSSEKFNHVSFQQWLVDYNLREEVRGHTSAIEALELYWDDVLKDECDELQEEFHRSRTRWFEECRREFYGHARDEYSPLIDRLRGSRAECERITDWNNEHYYHLASVRENMGRICSILTTRIAMEREPTDEQWQRILEMGREAVRQIREAMRDEPATRDVNWNQLFAQLSEVWEVQDDSAIGDLDESEAEGERTPRLRSRFLQQAPVAESDDYSEGEETEPWQDCSHEEAAPEWSSIEG